MFTLARAPLLVVPALLREHAPVRPVGASMKSKVKLGFTKAVRKVLKAFTPAPKPAFHPPLVPTLFQTPTNSFNVSASSTSENSRKRILPRLMQGDKHKRPSIPFSAFITPPSRIKIPTPTSSIVVHSPRGTWAMRTPRGEYIDILENGQVVTPCTTRTSRTSRNDGYPTTSRSQRRSPSDSGISFSSELNTPTPAALPRLLITEATEDDIARLLYDSEDSIAEITSSFDSLYVESMHNESEGSLYGELHETQGHIMDSNNAGNGCMRVEWDSPTQSEYVHGQTLYPILEEIESDTDQLDPPSSDLENVMTELRVIMSDIDLYAACNAGSKSTLGFHAVDTVEPEKSSENAPQLQYATNALSYMSTSELRDDSAETSPAATSEIKGDLDAIGLEASQDDGLPQTYEVTVANNLNNIKEHQPGQEGSRILLRFDDEDKTVFSSIDITCTSTPVFTERRLPKCPAIPLASSKHSTPDYPSRHDLAQIIGRILAFSAEQSEPASNLSPSPAATIEQGDIPALTDEVIADLWMLVKLETETINRRRYALDELSNFLVQRNSALAIDRSSILNLQNTSSAFTSLENESLAHLPGCVDILTQHAACNDAFACYISKIIGINKQTIPPSSGPSSPPTAQANPPSGTLMFTYIMETAVAKSTDHAVKDHEHINTTIPTEDDALELDMITERDGDDTVYLSALSLPVADISDSSSIAHGDIPPPVEHVASRPHACRNTDSIDGVSPTPSTISVFLEWHQQTTKLQHWDQRDLDEFFGGSPNGSLADELTKAESRQASWISLADNTPWMQRSRETLVVSKKQKETNARARSKMEKNTSQRPSRTVAKTGGRQCAAAQQRK
ncbi:uncharacterized protein LAESUDRAFT_730952 [Laetiporus sulphureus 93-53]|uniref:Uncharacterized protein n=1 Tax=Laetiporus sulphureus 93-53 TaxID=1314785 RepID=A0A165BUK6_9APHY|nr:uncharacterized protein LAESUDRAFT_730952 [Laetiporus sulphureus 93-53]KZT01682.1 hypothetical protein LAESUDRAFT_730952 [Laetiporus sulphureus 93-53]